LELVPAAQAAEKGCLSCHEGIERFSDAAMQDTIEAMAADLGGPGGCIICHGGTPTATTAEAAHNDAPKDLKADGGPQMFYPDPGSLWIAQNTCGQCHKGYAERLTRSLMNTEGPASYRAISGPGVCRRTTRWSGETTI
jgi:hypothetical protein